LIRPFTNIDLLKSNFSAQVTVVGVSQQAQASLLALYASPGGSFDNVTLFEPDCPTTFDGCTLPRKYVPIEFNSPVNATADSIAGCVTCDVRIIGGVEADAGMDQMVCEEEDGPVNLSATLTNGVPPLLYQWSDGLGSTQMVAAFPLVTTTYTVTITDANGCSSTDDVRVTVEDCVPDCGAPPIISCPPDAELCPGADANTNLLGFATAAPGDPNCPMPSVVVRDSIVSDEQCLTIINRIWTAQYTQSTGDMNISTCIQEIRFVDGEEPVWTFFPSDVSVTSDDACMAVVSWTEPTATDNCGIATILGSSDSGSSFDLGTTYVIYEARDECDNSVIDSFSVTVIQACCTDTPTISCPLDYTGCPMSDIDPMTTGMATISGDSEMCGLTEISYVDNIQPFGSCQGQQLVLRTWSAFYTDRPDLSATCIQRIYLQDTLPPILTNCPSDVTLDPDSPIHTWLDPIISEDCGFTLSYNIESGSTFPTGDTRVIATASDRCGNIDTCSFVVTVPSEVQIICPTMPILRCLDTLLLEQVPAAMTETECDLCTEDSDCVSVDVTIDSTRRINDEQRVYYVTYQATDLCGTDNQCSTQIFIENGSFIECPADIVVEAPPFGFDYISWEPPVFETCCDRCIPNELPGFLYMGQLGESYYYCSFARTTWSRAKREAEGVGGHLAVITSREENDFLSRRLIERRAYIGLSDSREEGTFEWVTGEDLSFTRWKQGQPDDMDGEDFAELNSQGYWYDVDGTERLEFVVELTECDHVTQIEGPRPGSKFRVGTTTISYMAEDGCGNSAECSFNITLTPHSGVEEINDDPDVTTELVEDLSIWPNPTSDLVSVRSVDTPIDIIRVLHIDGTIMHRQNAVATHQYQIDASDYQSGVYVIHIGLSDGSTITRHMIVL